MTTMTRTILTKLSARWARRLIMSAISLAAISCPGGLLCKAPDLQETRRPTGSANRVNELDRDNHRPLLGNPLQSARRQKTNALQLSNEEPLPQPTPTATPPRAPFVSPGKTGLCTSLSAPHWHRPVWKR